MWYGFGTDMEMTEGDFGISLPIKITGVTLSGTDSIKITIKRRMDGETVLEKTFTGQGIQDNQITLELTEAESELLPVGVYVYAMDWYEDGTFMCNLVTSGKFMVVNKA